MGILRKQPKQTQDQQGQGSDWISPAQMLAQPGAPAAGGRPKGAAKPVPARLRPVLPAGPGRWLGGELRLAPGSLLWAPAKGVAAEPVELATATKVIASASGPGPLGAFTEVDTPQGRFQLDMDPVLFEMSQELVTGQPGDQQAPPFPPFPSPGSF